MKNHINWIPALVMSTVSLPLTVFVDASVLSDEFASLFGGLKLGAVVALLGLPAMILAILFFTMLHYRCWAALPTEYRATTPGKAIGFLFIPIFNLYWAFVSFPKLATGYVAHAKARQPDRVGHYRGLGMAYAIVFVCANTIGVIPGAMSIVMTADVVIFIFFYGGLVDYANRFLIEPVSDAEQAAPPTRR